MVPLSRLLPFVVLLPTAASAGTVITGAVVTDSAASFALEFAVTNVLDNAGALPSLTGQDYAAAGTGTATFIDFAFDRPYEFTSVTYVDRAHNQGLLTNPTTDILQVWYGRSDANNDEKIQQSELVQDSVAFFDSADSDGDGRWLPEEAAAANAETLRLLQEEASRPNYLALETNPSQLAPPDGGGPGGGGPGDGGGLADISTQLDKNGDGTVTRDEAVLDGEARFAAINQNGDDFVSRVEAIRFGRVETQSGLWAGDDASRIGGTQDFTTGFDLIFSTNAVFGDADDVIVSSGSIAIPVAPSGYDDFATTISIPGITAQYLRWDVTATTGANPGANAFVFAGSAVPEPGSWVSMIAGFGLVGAMRRRRRPARYSH